MAVTPEQYSKTVLQHWRDFCGVMDCMGHHGHDIPGHISALKAHAMALTTFIGNYASHPYPLAIEALMSAIIARLEGRRVDAVNYLAVTTRHFMTCDHEIAKPWATVLHHEAQMARTEVA